MKRVFLSVFGLGLLAGCLSPEARRGRAIATHAAVDSSGQPVGPASPSEIQAQRHFMMGHHWRQRGQFDRALAAFKQARDSLQPSDSPFAWGAILNEYGLTLIAANRYAEAVPVIEQALTYNTKSQDKVGIPVSHLNLGDAHARQGNLDRAQEHWQKAEAAAAKSGVPGIKEAVRQRLEDAAPTRERSSKTD